MIRQLATTFANEFHQLDRALFPSTGSVGSRVIQFTASNFGEGVTSTTLAFAVFMSGVHGSDEVIAVEANLRKPSFNDMLRIRPARNLLDILDRGDPVDSAIQKVSDYGVTVISAGEGAVREDRLAYESFLHRLAEMFTELRTKYRYILVDTPPVISFVDASIVAGMTDGVVLVVESNVTRSEVVERAAEKLKASGPNISGIVLNKREFNIPKWIYRFL